MGSRMGGTGIPLPGSAQDRPDSGRLRVRAVVMWGGMDVLPFRRALKGARSRIKQERKP
jgi:hypothetical protein